MTHLAGQLVTPRDLKTPMYARTACVLGNILSIKSNAGNSLSSNKQSIRENIFPIYGFSDECAICYAYYSAPSHLQQIWLALIVFSTAMVCNMVRLSFTYFILDFSCLMIVLESLSQNMLSLYLIICITLGS